MKAQFRLVEMLTLDLKPHPLKVEKGDFLLLERFVFPARH